MRAVLGLWIAGWGFLFIALGLVFAQNGYADLIVLGALATIVGHLVQRFQAANASRGG